MSEAWYEEKLRKVRKYDGAERALNESVRCAIDARRRGVACKLRENPYSTTTKQHTIKGGGYYGQ